MKATENLGLTMYVSVFAVRACPPPDRMKRILKGLVEWIGMTTADLAPQVWYYPWEGMGGEGETVILPFVCVQPLMESLSCGLGQIGVGAADTWREHGGTYIIIASCRPYSVQRVASYLGQEAGLVVDFGEAPPVTLRPNGKGGPG